MLSWNLQPEIGKGAFADVYHSKFLGNDVAVKVFRHEMDFAVEQYNWLRPLSSGFFSSGDLRTAPIVPILAIGRVVSPERSCVRYLMTQLIDICKSRISDS